MPRLVYTGPHDAVDLPALGLACKRGEPVTVPAEAAGPLLEQAENWQRAAAAKEE